jgi:hypothetical protein
VLRRKNYRENYRQRDGADDYAERDIDNRLVKFVILITLQKLPESGIAVRAENPNESFGDERQKHFYADKTQDKRQRDFQVMKAVG